MDFDKNLRYIEIKSSGLSVNATFSPSDPAKVMQLLEAQTQLRKNPEFKDSLNRSTKTQTFETGQEFDPMKQVVYEDHSVRITREEIIILKYYYPIPMNRNIRI